MKPILIFLTAILSLCCTNNISNEIEHEKVAVSFKLTGEYEKMEDQKYTPSGTSEITAIQIYQKGNTSTAKYKPYCYGLWDNPSVVNVTLNRGLQYKIEVTVLPDAKNVVARDAKSGNYLQPFSFFGSIDHTGITNSFTYSTVDYFSYISRGTTAMIEDKSYKVYARPTTDRYYGQVADVECDETNNEITVPVKRVIFGLKYDIKGFDEGLLIVELKSVPKIILTPQDYEQRQSIITLQGSTFDATEWIGDNYFETVPFTVTWQKDDGTMIKVVERENDFQRKMLYNMKIDLANIGFTGGINIKFEEGELGNGTDI